MNARFVRLAERDRTGVQVLVDGTSVWALAGDLPLAAVLTQGRRVRDSEFSDGARAGFCLMRACSTPVRGAWLC